MVVGIRDQGLVFPEVVDVFFDEFGQDIFIKRIE